MKVRARVAKTVQEIQYEPFVAEVEIEGDEEEIEASEALDKAEKIVDSKMTERAEKEPWRDYFE